MGNLLSLYFLHPFKTRLANKTQRFNPRYELTNPTKTPPLSTLFPIPFSLCYYLPFLCYSVSSSPVTTLPFLCYPVSSSPVTIPCSFVTLSPHPLLLFSVPLLLCLPLPCPPSLSCKECLPVLSTGAFTLSKTRPFKHAEHALLAP